MKWQDGTPLEEECQLQEQKRQSCCVPIYGARAILLSGALPIPILKQRCTFPLYNLQLLPIFYKPLNIVFIDNVFDFKTLLWHLQPGWNHIFCGNKCLSFTGAGEVWRGWRMLPTHWPCLQGFCPAAGKVGWSRLGLWGHPPIIPYNIYNTIMILSQTLHQSASVHQSVKWEQ